MDIANLFFFKLDKNRKIEKLSESMLIHFDICIETGKYIR